MTFDQMHALAIRMKNELPAGSSTAELFRRGTDAIGKKLVEEAAESWMAAKFQKKEDVTLELSQVLYYVAVMLAEKGVSLEEVYAKL